MIEDHLAQSVTAGLAAGLTETEAQQAAISAFGSVAVVVRAHTTHRVRLRVLAADLPVVAWKLAWLWLLGSGAAHVLIAVLLPGISVIAAPPGHVLKPPPLSPALVFQASWMLALGAGLAAGYHLVRAGRPNPLGGFFPLAAALFFVVAAPAAGAISAVKGVVGPQGAASVFAMAGLAALYAARMAGTLIGQWRTS